MAIEGKGGSALGQRIRLGMVGGGEGAFIGAVHRIAARMDDHYELVAGALSSTPEKARRSGEALGLDADRIYDDYETMAASEAQASGRNRGGRDRHAQSHARRPERRLPDGGRPCDLRQAAERPRLAEAKKIAATVAKSGRIFALTHNYTGYPLVRRAREMVRDGALGEIRLIQVEYPQEWLTESIEATGQKQAAWRVDPKRSGAGGALGDIGTHAYNLADYVSGLDLKELAADLSSFGKGRVLDDNAQILLRYANGARGAMWVSQVAPGHENGLKLRIYGTRGSLQWIQAEPNQMLYAIFGKATRILTTNGPDSGEAAARMVRVPAGHPEGYLEAFANIYAEVALAIKAARKGKKAAQGLPFPDDRGWAERSRLH